MKNAWKLMAVVGLALTVHGATGSSPAPDHAPKPAMAKPAAKPETKATAKPESKPETKHESKPESKPETKAAGKGDSKPAADDHDEHDSADHKSDNKSDNKPESKPDNTSASASHADVTKAMDPDAALKLLQEGNERWVSGKVENPNTSAERRNQQATEGQTPFVTVLTCADSRLPVERVFDRGVGEVFVIRVAGNVAGPHEAGTIEYGAGHLNSRLLVVMGHTKCGAVAAAASDGKFNQNVGSLVENIKPAVERAKSNGAAEGAGLVAAAVKENVWQSVFDLLRTSPDLCKMVKAGQVKIVGAVCDVSNGKVEWMGEHPWQDALVQAFTSRDTATANAETHDSH
ncbi:MAG TPA: carbonic anhydrase [Phycisphaerales bacterium]